MSKTHTLAPVLVRGYLRDDLCCNITCRRKAMRFFNHCSADNCSVLQHIIKIDEIAIVHTLDIVVCVMKMYYPFPMSFYYILGKQQPFCHITADFTSQIISLNTVDYRIFVAVLLLSLFIIAVNKTHDISVCSILSPKLCSFISVCNIMTGSFISTVSHYLIFYHILDFFYG